MPLMYTGDVGVNTFDIPISIIGLVGDLSLFIEHDQITDSVLVNNFYNSSTGILSFPYNYTSAGDYYLSPGFTDTNGYQYLYRHTQITIALGSGGTPYTSIYLTDQDVRAFLAMNGYNQYEAEGNPVYSHDRVQMHLDAATQIINGFFAGLGYPIPVKCPNGDVPSVIKQLILDELEYRLHCSCLNDCMIFKYKQSLALREQIRKRQYLITCSDGTSLSTVVQTGNATTVYVHDGIEAMKKKYPKKTSGCGGCNE